METLDKQGMVIRSDNNGHTFHIPKTTTAKFDELMQEIHNAAWLSNAWYEAVDKFNAQFLKYFQPRKKIVKRDKENE